MYNSQYFSYWQSGVYLWYWDFWMLGTRVVSRVLIDWVIAILDFLNIKYPDYK